MNQLIQLLDAEILGNPLKRYLLSLFVFVISIFALKFFERSVIRRLRGFATGPAAKVNLFFIDIVEKELLPVFYFGAFYFAATQLQLDPSIARLVRGLTVVILTIQAARTTISVALFFFEEFWLKQQQFETAFAFRSMMTILKIGVWAISAVFVLDNLGFNVSAVVAGLGITGVAVALATQSILGDLINYFVIFLDKPFIIGDAVCLGDHAGTIEHIGIKTTHIRSANGEQLILPNSMLTSSVIRNMKRMPERRVQFKLGVVYETPTEKLKRITPILREIIEAVQGARFDRAHFLVFSASSLDWEIVYHISTGDYNKYADIQESINFRVKEAFEKEGIEFAYPTQTIYEHRLQGD